MDDCGVEACGTVAVVGHGPRTVAGDLPRLTRKQATAL
jgi:hypothetical protein